MLVLGLDPRSVWEWRLRRTRYRKELTLRRVRSVTKVSGSESADLGESPRVMTSSKDVFDKNDP